MQDELIVLDSVELREPSFSEGPEGLYAVDVALASNELVPAVEDPVMVVAVEDEPVVGLPAVGVDRAAFEHLALYYRHQSGPAHRRDNGDEHLAASLKQPEHRRLPGSSSAPSAAHSASSEIGLVNLYLPREAHHLLVLP